MADTFRALCVELVKAWDATADFDFNDFGHAAADIVNRARAELAKPEPVPRKPVVDYSRVPKIATEAQIRSAAQYLVKKRNCAGDLIPAIEYAIARWGAPTIQPVPVSERPWEREGWCDAEGRCWWGHPSDDQTNAGWVPGTWEDVEMVGLDSFTISLPHHALPTPEANQ